MENRSRNTIASRATILQNSDSSVPKQSPSRNTITSRATILGNNNSGAPKQQPMKKLGNLIGQRDIKNREDYTTGHMVDHREAGMTSGGNTGERKTDLNLKVSPPPYNHQLQRMVEVQSKRSVSNDENMDTISVDRLQEAIIWSEILGEPKSRRRRHRS